MGKKISIGTAIALVLFAILLAFTMTYRYLNVSYQKKLDEYYAYTQMYEKLYNLDEIVRSEYIRDIDDDKIMDGVLSGYMSGLGDKYGMYYTEEEFEALKMQLSGKMVGIGITCSYNEQKNAIEVLSVRDNSPAQNAGMEIGDLITGVGSLTVEKNGYSETVAAINGDEGESVSLTVVKVNTGNISELKLSRAVVNYSSVSYRIYQNYIGIVQITEFNKNTAEEFKTAMESLKNQNITAYIFDVRNNLGGDLDAICEVLDYILPEGPIVRLRDARGNETVRSSGESHLEGKMCVLINNYTASAAELFSAGIRDYKYGTLIGTTTYGKGTVQSIKELADHSGLRLTTEYYLPPFGDNYDGVGVAPDILVEYEAGKDGNEDSQITAAIENIDSYYESSED